MTITDFRMQSQTRHARSMPQPKTQVLHRVRGMRARRQRPPEHDCRKVDIARPGVFPALSQFQDLVEAMRCLTLSTLSSTIRLANEPVNKCNPICRRDKRI